GAGSGRTGPAAPPLRTPVAGFVGLAPGRAHQVVCEARASGGHPAMIDSIVASSLRLRTVVVCVAAIVMTVGVTRLGDMRVDVFPEILPVTVNVQTEALGLSAAEVEQLITVPIEADLLAGTPWVDVMRSESVPGLSSIELTFKPGTDAMHARQVVQER